MGFVGFLRFSLLCFDFLAWPVFALGYPLWASIRAIETSSKHRMRKLVTYWTIFSLISLFEIFFVKLIQWVPLWPYIKLVTICLLVIPQFNGACHVYQCLIHPCLSVNRQDIINWFCIPKEKPSSEELFVASAETYLKENGPEALEKLITSKAKGKEHILTDADALEVVKRVEPTEKNVTAEQLVEHPKPHLFESDKMEIAAAEAQSVTTPEESKEKRPLEIHALKKVQREWTCAMCQVTTTSEADLNSHLLGKKHRSKCEELNTSTQTATNMQSSAVKHEFKSEELKTSIQTAKNMQSSAAKHKSKHEELKTSTQTAKNMQSSAAKHKSKPEELKTSTQTANNLNSAAVKTNESNQAKKKLKICLPGEGSKQNTTEKPKCTRINAASGQQMQEKPKKKNAGVVDQQSKLWCGICNISCPGEIHMTAHLIGKRHALNMQSRISSVGGG